MPLLPSFQAHLGKKELHPAIVERRECKATVPLHSRFALSSFHDEAAFMSSSHSERSWGRSQRSTTGRCASWM